MPGMEGSRSKGYLGCMPKRIAQDPIDLTAGQAQYVIARLISERRVTAKDVARFAAEMDSEISELETRLQFLRRVSGREDVTRKRRGRAPATNRAEAAPRKRRKSRRKPRLTPEWRARLKKQGHYLALMRQVRAGERAKFKAMFREQGIDAAIAALERVVPK